MKTEEDAGEAAPRYPIRGPDADNPGHLHAQDMFLANWQQATVANAIQAIALRRRETDAMKLRHEQEVHAARLELAAMVELRQVLERRVAAMWADMGAVYGLDFAKVSYDDETGKLLVLDINDT